VQLQQHVGDALGAFFGRYGDRPGRNRMLALTVLTMSGATFLIGILPTYASWGMAAPILLFLLRCAQGFSTGEYTGASAFIVEYAPVFRSLEQHDEVEPAPLREAVRRCGRQIATLFGYSITNPAKVRASGSAIGYTAAYALFGGTAPFVATGWCRRRAARSRRPST
jgi:MFS family permease